MNSQEAHPMVRTVVSTQSEMTEIILPNDTNMLGNLLGGRLMHFIDLTGAMAAYRHSRTHVVTAAMDPACDASAGCCASRRELPAPAVAVLVRGRWALHVSSLPRRIAGITAVTVDSC